VPSDAVAKKHDLVYTLNPNNPEAIRKADRDMVNKLKDIERKGLDSKFNTQLGMRLIQGKMLAEDAGVLDKGKFSSGKQVSSEDRQMLNSRLRDLEMEGYGMKSINPNKKKQIVGAGLKAKILKDIKGKGLTIAGATAPALPSNPPISGKGVSIAGKGVKVAGSGLRIAGDKGGRGLFNEGISNIINKYADVKVKPEQIKSAFDFTMNTIVPNLHKVAGIVSNIKGKGVNLAGGAYEDDLLRNIRGSKNLGDLSERIGQTLYPKLISRYMYQKDLKGDGAISDFFKQLSSGWFSGKNKNSYDSNENPLNRHILNPLKDLTGRILLSLGKGISSGLFGSSNPSVVGNKIFGGQGFWGDLWNGFKYGWNKTKEVLGKLPIPVVQQVIQKIPDMPKSTIEFRDGKLVDTAKIKQ